MNKIGIPFNKVHTTGAEAGNVQRIIEAGNLSAGDFTENCKAVMKAKYSFPETIFTTSCTDALELAALLLDIREGDEIIIPSYTFVSTANPFILRGAKIIFADSSPDSPHINAALVESLITSRTKAIIVMHYGGILCDMDTISAIAARYGLDIIEDAAHALHAAFRGKVAGSFGRVAAFSFHFTKNITCGEGGMLVINDKSLVKRAGIISEKGTNRNEFLNGEVNKYDWVDVGSSFRLSEMHAAFLSGQLGKIEEIQQKRMMLWKIYHERLTGLQKEGFVRLPGYDKENTGNAHIFYVVCDGLRERNNLIAFLKQNDIMPAFHYTALHQSPFFAKLHDGRILHEAAKYADCLLRLPLFYDLEPAQAAYVADKVIEFFRS